MSFTTTTVSTTSPPFRTIRGGQGTVSIEKHYTDVNPNCALVIIALVLGIFLPASIAAVAPVASIVLLIVSVIFPGIPLFLANKMWRIDIDNAGREFKVIRWHAFYKTKKNEVRVKFDDVREIVAETSPDGAKRRLVAILLTGTRHVLYESMNVAHADRFKQDFMSSIQLNPRAAFPRAVRPSPQAAPASPDTSPAPSPADQTQPVPSLRQFAIPDPGAAPGAALVGYQPPPDAPPIRVTSWIRDDVDGVDDLDGTTGSGFVDGSGNPTGQGEGQAAVAPPAAGGPGAQVAAPPDEDGEAISYRLAEIARRKREILSRVYQPGSEPARPPSADAPGGPGGQAGGGPSRPSIRNVEDWYNKFDACGGLGYLLPAELGGCTPAGLEGTAGALEFRAGRAPKKKDGDGEDEVITHRVDRKTERELSVKRVRPTCMVCTRPLKGASFICPTCETKYCMRCARALAARKEACWTCRKQLKA